MELELKPFLETPKIKKHEVLEAEQAFKCAVEIGLGPQVMIQKAKLQRMEIEQELQDKGYTLIKRLKKFAPDPKKNWPVYTTRAYAVETFAEEIPRAVLEKIQEEQAVFHDFEVWAVKEIRDPVLVGVRYVPFSGQNVYALLGVWGNDLV